MDDFARRWSGSQEAEVDTSESHLRLVAGGKRVYRYDQGGGILRGASRVPDRLVSFDVRFAPEHAGYYIRGLLEHARAGRLPLTRRGFPSSYSDRQPLAFVLQRGGERRGIYIAAGDPAEIDAGALAWADVYGKVNLLHSALDRDQFEKVVAIGPSYGLRVWRLPEAARYAVMTALRRGRVERSWGEHYRHFWLLCSRRLEADHYEPAPSEERYVFFNAWLWQKHPEVNPPRAEFIRVCRGLQSVDFEGGFIRRPRNDMPEYDDLTANERYPLPQYLANTKRSAVVFNNPAVHGCHGWKLAEFLALGKAIISLPLSREMPAPLRHGEHVHYVDGSRESIAEAVTRLVADRPYRRRLEAAARRYYLEHLTPQGVIRRLADHAFAR